MAGTDLVDAQAQTQGIIDLAQLFGRNHATAAQQARLFYGHDLFALDIGVIG